MQTVVNLSEQKRLLRARIKPFLRELATEPERRAALSKDLAERVQHSEAWRGAKCILLFASLPDEIDTMPLLEAAIAVGKTVLLPRVAGDDLEICSYTPGLLSHGAYGISEPTAGATVVTDLSIVELALIPGIAFTRDGDRLGRGRGYYDRLLPCLTCPTFGLGYPLQLVDTLPTEPWDCKLSGVFI